MVGIGVKRTLDCEMLCCVLPSWLGVAIITWVSFGLLEYRNNRTSGNEHINEKVARDGSPMNNPYTAATERLAII